MIAGNYQDFLVDKGRIHQIGYQQSTIIITETRPTSTNRKHH